MNLHDPDPLPEIVHLEHKKRRFSQDTINDLLFWGVHFCVVAVALGFVWIKIDRLSVAIKVLYDAESTELQLVRDQAANSVRLEATKALQSQTVLDTQSAVLRQVLQVRKEVEEQLAKTQASAAATTQVAQKTQDAVQKTQDVVEAKVQPKVKIVTRTRTRYRKAKPVPPKPLLQRIFNP
jgi:hypothetical protein